jgi:hypothetical protein
MIRQKMTFYDPAFLLLYQIGEYLLQVAAATLHTAFFFYTSE